MSAKSCYSPMCDSEVELSCNCTSPETFSCTKHLAEHCKSSSKPHNISSIFLEIFENTKDELLNFLAEEKIRSDSTKAKIIFSYSKTLFNYKNSVEEVLKQIDSDSARISSYIENLLKMQKISKFETDPVLNLITLQSNEAVRKAKAIFKPNNRTELINKMRNQIDKIISNFNEEIAKFNGMEILSVESMNFDNERFLIQKVLNLMKNIIRYDPNNDKAYNRIGDIFYEEKRFREAIKYYNNAIRINPNEKIYSANKGITLERLWKIEEAIEWYKEAIRIDPNNHDAYNSLGTISYNEERYDDAIRYYNEAIRIDPNLAIYYINKGNALAELGSAQEAIEYYKNAIKIYPNYYKLVISDMLDIKIDILDIQDIQVIQDIQFKNEKRYEEAIRYYNDAIKLNANYALHYINKGIILKVLGRRSEAIECYKKAIKIDPNQDDVCNDIGMIFMMERNGAEAKKFFDEAIRINPSEPNYYENRRKLEKSVWFNLPKKIAMAIVTEFANYFFKPFN